MDPALVFFNQAHRTDYVNWDFDETGYLQRSTTDLYNAMVRLADEDED